ncbi:hypothetical protein NIES2101_41250 [Calothrix sp. HK-06]|nr:hypothetical protein NIES2101_41250 [Calothrix sp. HK-06]
MNAVSIDSLTLPSLLLNKCSCLLNYLAIKSAMGNKHVNYIRKIVSLAQLEVKCILQRKGGNSYTIHKKPNSKITAKINAHCLMSHISAVKLLL